MRRPSLLTEVFNKRLWQDCCRRQSKRWQSPRFWRIHFKQILLAPFGYGLQPFGRYALKAHISSAASTTSTRTRCSLRTSLLPQHDLRRPDVQALAIHFRPRLRGLVAFLVSTDDTLACVSECRHELGHSPSGHKALGKLGSLSRNVRSQVHDSQTVISTEETCAKI